MTRIQVGLAVAVLAGCGASRPRTPDAAPRPPAPRDARAAAIAVDASAAVAVAPEPKEGDEPLEREERERNPRSSTVKLKLTVSPAARGTIHWGRKRLAEVRPGDMTVEIERPRGSGPLDLVVRAEGFLPHHVRLFTDRDDRLSLRLIRAEEAPGLLGYKRVPVPPPMP